MGTCGEHGRAMEGNMGEHVATLYFVYDFDPCCIRYCICSSTFILVALTFPLFIVILVAYNIVFVLRS